MENIPENNLEERILIQGHWSVYKTHYFFVFALMVVIVVTFISFNHIKTIYEKSFFSGNSDSGTEEYGSPDRGTGGFKKDCYCDYSYLSVDSKTICTWWSNIFKTESERIADSQLEEIFRNAYTLAQNQKIEGLDINPTGETAIVAIQLSNGEMLTTYTSGTKGFVDNSEVNGATLEHVDRMNTDANPVKPVKIIKIHTHDSVSNIEMTSSVIGLIDGDYETITSFCDEEIEGTVSSLNVTTLPSIFDYLEMFKFTIDFYAEQSRSRIPIEYYVVTFSGRIYKYEFDTRSKIYQTFVVEKEEDLYNQDSCEEYGIDLPCLIKTTLPTMLVTDQQTAEEATKKYVKMMKELGMRITLIEGVDLNPND